MAMDMTNDYAFSFCRHFERTKFRGLNWCCKHRFTVFKMLKLLPFLTIGGHCLLQGKNKCIGYIVPFTDTKKCIDYIAAVTNMILNNE
jgi:hypothetical protein